MKINMVFADRLLRMLIAATLVVLYFGKLIPEGIGLLLMIVAVVFFVTSFTGYCPLYGLLGIGNKKKTA